MLKNMITVFYSMTSSTRTNQPRLNGQYFQIWMLSMISSVHLVWVIFQHLCPPLIAINVNIL